MNSSGPKLPLVDWPSFCMGILAACVAIITFTIVGAAVMAWSAY